jgi:predicted SprT family Zn-dependent metalloprotease
MDATQVKSLATSLISQHVPHYSFGFHGKANSLGTCNYRHKRIYYSKYFLHLTEDEVRDTILHEIAHALTQGDGHGRRWKQECVRLGAKPERCAAPGIQSTKQEKYILSCSKCGFSRKVFRKLKRERSCSKCCPRYFNRDFLLTLTLVR